MTEEPTQEELMGFAKDQIVRSAPIVNALNLVLGTYDTGDVVPALGMALALQAKDAEQLDQWMVVLACFAVLVKSGAVDLHVERIDHPTTSYQ